LNGRVSKFSEGAWGIMRVLDKEVPDLQKLPAGYSRRNEIPKPLGVCPADAPVKALNVVAIDYPGMKLNPHAPDVIEVDFERTIKMVNPEAKIYTLEEDASQVASGIHPMPLTLRANVGDCIKIKLTNRMKEGRASFSAISLASIPKILWERMSATILVITPSAPGRIGPTPITQTPFIGEMASLVWDWGNCRMPAPAASRPAFKKMPAGVSFQYQ
jgi:hypothetical protein